MTEVARVHVNNREAITNAFTSTLMSIPSVARRRLDVESLFTILREIPGFVRRLSTDPSFHERAVKRHIVRSMFDSEDEGDFFYDYDVEYTYGLRQIGVKACVYYRENAATSSYDFSRWLFKFRGVEVHYCTDIQELDVILRSKRSSPAASERFEIQVSETWSHLTPPSLSMH